ncbi:MAG: ABC transporter permease [Chloroflexi bacterium]|nr:MAG: ABC transporter permease [Chloroflexota bacterium]
MEATTPVSSSAPESGPPRGGTWLRTILDAVLVPILAVFSALVIGAVIIVVTDAEVYAAFREGFGAGLGAIVRSVAVAYGALFSGSLGDANAISESLVASTPYIFAGLAVALGFRGGLFNIGGEGQLLVAAGVSVVIGYSFQLPAIIHLPLALLGGMLGGAIYGAIPGYLKAKTGAHEVINTIMMNYIAFRFFDWAFTGPLRRPGGDAPVTAEIYPSAYLPQLFEGYRFHWGFFLALAVAFGVWWLLFKTTLGFEIRTVGANPNAARYGGIKITRITVLTMAISGGLAGLAGSNEVLGLNHFLAGGFSAGYGFDAIALALLGKSHPLGVVLASLLFGTLRNGATRMQSVASIPIDIISVVQALVIVFIAAPAIVRWIYRVRAREELERAVFTRGWGA